MDALGLRIEFKAAKWPENLKASRAGKLMMWGVGWSAGQPDGDTFLALGYGPNKGQANHARFDLPAFNELYERQRMLPDGPERQALLDAGEEADGRLHALQGARAPHHHRPDGTRGCWASTATSSCAISGSTWTSMSRCRRGAIGDTRRREFGAVSRLTPCCHEGLRQE